MMRNENEELLTLNSGYSGCLCWQEYTDTWGSQLFNPQWKIWFTPVPNCTWKRRQGLVSLDGYDKVLQVSIYPGCRWGNLLGLRLRSELI